MGLKCNHRTTFCRKPRLQKCSQLRAMANFEEKPKSAIFWNSSKGGPRENRPKRRPNSRAPKTPRRKFYRLLISMGLKYNHRTTFCRKPRLQKCSQLRAMANFEEKPKSAIFWNSSKGGPRENRPKRRPNSRAPKTPRRKFHRLLISMGLKYNHRTTFCHKPRLQKCSQLRAMATVAKTPKSAIFWNSSNGGRDFILWLVPWGDKMNQIARRDWLPELGGWSYVARSGLPAVSGEKNVPKSQIISPFIDH